jgi:glycerophosphoryl diester phosphodiesterase
MTIDSQALPLKRRSLPVAAPPPSPPHRARPPIMRPRRWIGVLIGLILSFGSTAAGVDARSFEVVAHRGEATRAPENSIAAIHAAAAAGVTWVELDLRYTKDGIPLVIHDDYVGRVTGLGHNRRVADLTFAQIRGKCLLWANGGCSRRACTPATRATCVSVKDRAPSLWEALKVAKRVGLRVFLDVKVAAPNETARMKTIRAFVDTGTHKDSIIIAFDGSVLSDLGDPDALRHHAGLRDPAPRGGIQGRHLDPQHARGLAAGRGGRRRRDPDRPGRGPDRRPTVSAWGPAVRPAGSRPGSRRRSRPPR